MNFYQHIHPQCVSLLMKVAQLSVIERRHNQQNAVSTDGTRFRDLITVCNKVFTNHRQVAGIASGNQVILMTLEEVGIGQHRETRRTALSITFGNVCRMKLFTHHAFRGRGFFHLSDHRCIPLGNTLIERINEATGRTLFFCQREQIGLGYRLLTLSHFLVFTR